VNGQIAVNQADGKIFYRNSSGVVTTLSTGSGGVTEVYEYATTANFPATGSSAQLVIATDTGRVYRWMGTFYVEVGSVGGSVADTRWDLFLPPAPTGVTASPGNAQATVSWTAPTVLSQASITDYTVQYQPSGGAWTTFSRAASTATTATVTGLTNGTAYTFRVAGVNAVGTGSYSNATSSVTPVNGDPYFSSVSLLLHADGSGSTFADSSGYSRSVPAYGNATQSATQSKFGGKSLYLDGSGDYLQIASSTAFGFGTGDFTIEYWHYPLQNSGNETHIDTRPSDSAAWLVLGKSSAGAVRCYDGSSVRTGGSMNLNAWNHIAWVRSSGVNTLYLNGSSVITFTNSGDAGSSCGLTIGSNVLTSAENTYGFIDDLRITKGIARTITVPTAAYPDRGPYTDPFMDKVSLLLHADGTGSTFVDSSITPKTLSAANATQSATQYKFGGKSAFFSGASDYLSASGVSIGTGEFVLEMWFKTASSVQYAQLIGNEGSGGSEGFSLLINNNSSTGGQIALYRGSLIVSTPSGDYSDDAWHHVAVSRSGTTVRLYVDGTLASSATSSANFSSSAAMFIAYNNQFSPRNMVGYVDDVRISVGTDRNYTGSTITVPSAAFPDA
jgi:hypothetical protein